MTQRIILLLSLLLAMTISQTLAQTQTELNRASTASYSNADQRLNAVYNRILAEYRSDTLFTQSLKASQRIWLKFRDAELKMMYPYTEERGSVASMCESAYLEKLTNERIKTLQQCITGTQEGDVCSGSLKTH